MDPVVKRWVSATIQPVAARLRTAAQAYLNKEYTEFASLLDSPIFELAVSAQSDHLGTFTQLETLLKWCLKGHSPGRLGGAEVTHADDLVLSAIGATLLSLTRYATSSSGVPPTLTAVVVASADTARECALGQWLNLVQGVEAVAAVRRKGGDLWVQEKKLGRIASLMIGQVAPVLAAAARGEIELGHMGARSIISVSDPSRGLTERQLTVRAQGLTEDDWRLLKLAWKPKGEADPKRETWISFALIILCAAQMEVGWFDIVASPRLGKRQGPKRIVLSELAREALLKDAQRWLHLGFAFDPMVVPPIDCGYLTVHRRIVTGRNGPMGMRTDAQETDHAEIANRVMAGTAWAVNTEMLDAIEADGNCSLWDKTLEACAGNSSTQQFILAAHKREAATKQFYLPIYMDFRGRCYPRTTWLNYQGNDLQRSLLMFQHSGAEVGCNRETSHHGIALALHLSSRFGGPDKLDKAPLLERLAWMDDLGAMPRHRAEQDILNTADEPLTCLAAYKLLKLDQWDSIPVQMDGTCNGLQHLSALFRDHEAAPYVNLTESTYEDTPADIYQKVADLLLTEMQALMYVTPWVGRILKACVSVDRKLCKKPVMVLPYGGTLQSVADALEASILAQKPIDKLWKECLRMGHDGFACPDHTAIANGYMAFKDRPLERHPLFHSDVRQMAVLLWGCICQVIPKAMQAMSALREIAKKVGDQALSWETPSGLWVVHAYPKSASQRLQLKGLHLAKEVRGLRINAGRDEVDPHKHVTGLVANFIHSLDASHLVKTMLLASRHSPVSFGAIHDCLLCRPTDAERVGGAVRDAFAGMYGGNPLLGRVRLAEVGGTEWVEYPSWYAFAEAVGVELPDIGTWQPSQVIESKWFFS